MAGTPQDPGAIHRNTTKKKWREKRREIELSIELVMQDKLSRGAVNIVVTIWRFNPSLYPNRA